VLGFGLNNLVITSRAVAAPGGVDAPKRALSAGHHSTHHTDDAEVVRGLHNSLSDKVEQIYRQAASVKQPDGTWWAPPSGGRRRFLAPESGHTRTGSYTRNASGWTPFFEYPVGFCSALPPRVLSTSGGAGTIGPIERRGRSAF
jgi:hypothetical protein